MLTRPAPTVAGQVGTGSIPLSAQVVFRLTTPRSSEPRSRRETPVAGAPACRPYLAFDRAAEREPVARVGEADRAAEAVVPEAARPRHRPARERNLDTEGRRRLVAGHAVGPAAPLLGRAGNGLGREQADAVDAADDRCVYARQRMGRSRAIGGRELRRPGHRVVHDREEAWRDEEASGQASPGRGGARSGRRVRRRPPPGSAAARHGIGQGVGCIRSPSPNTRGSTCRQTSRRDRRADRLRGPSTAS
jgi:hypothetical protein